MNERDTDTERFDQLLERSSLGTPAAQRLRRRTSPEQVAIVRRLAQLRNRIAHPRNTRDSAAAAAELVGYLIELGYHGQADHVLHEWLPREIGSIVHFATTRALMDLAATSPPALAKLTLAPAGGHPPGDESQWHDELHLLYTELHNRMQAVALLPGHPPETHELVLVFPDTPDNMTRLATSVQAWLSHAPGRSLDLVVGSAAGSKRITVHSGATWSPTMLT